VAALLVFMAVGLFVFFLPVLTGRTISVTMWRARIWFACTPVHGWCQWNWY
jgi:dolichyl-phosphate-mannose--protein O-mannosyl transferase